MRRAAALATVLLLANLVGALTLGAQDVCTGLSGVHAEAGWQAYQEGDMVEAERRFRFALELCRSDGYALTGAGYVALRAGRIPEAVERWKSVVAVDRANVDAWVGLGLAAWRTGDLEGVRSTFGKVVNLERDNPTALEYLERLEAASAEPIPLTDEAGRAWSEGDAALALRLYSDRLAADPDDRVAALRVASIHGWEEDFDAATTILDAWIQRDPRDTEARVVRARVLAWAGDIERALGEIDAVLAIDADDREAQDALVLFGEWARDARQPVIDYPDPAGIVGGGGFEEARRLRNVGRFDVSKEAYLALLERDPEDLQARLGLASTLAFVGDYAGSVAEYDRVLARSPEASSALVGKSRTLGWAGRLAEAEAVARYAVKVRPTDAEAWAVLGRILYWQARNGAAYEAIERAARIAPTNADIKDLQRSVGLLLGPVVRPSQVWERDSDGSRSATTLLAAGWHPVPRLQMRAEASARRLDQDLLIEGDIRRTAWQATVGGTFETAPGWLASLAVGGARNSGAGGSGELAVEAGIASPGHRAFSARLELSSEPLLATALLADRGVRSTEGLVTARYAPAPGWRVDANVGFGSWSGSEANGHRSASASVSRRWSDLSLGTSLRAFSFEKNLNDGYFDPDFYGIAEVTAYWLRRQGAWTFLVELAPGLQQVGRDGEPTAAIRGHARVAYRWASAREVSASYGSSTAGLARRTPGPSRYRYEALVIGLSWVP